MELPPVGAIRRAGFELARQRTRNLAANLLDSLPGVLSGEDEGIAGALRRDAEANLNPDQTISLSQLDSRIESRRSS